MSKCKNCGEPNPVSAAYKQRETCSNRCRTAYSRSKESATPRNEARQRVQPIAVAKIEPGDPGLVGRVEKLIATRLDLDDEVAAAQAALALELANLAASGSVSACRELRLLLLEMRVATDPTYEGEVTQALVFEILVHDIRGDGGGVNRAEPAGLPLPPGWRSTAQDGQLLEWLGHEWCRLRDIGDVDGFHTLERWIGHHSIELECIRTTGRWSVWPDARDSL